MADSSSAYRPSRTQPRPQTSGNLPNIPNSSSQKLGQRRDGDLSGDMANMALSTPQSRAMSSRQGARSSLRSSTPSEVSEWRRDKNMATWYAAVQNRKKSASVKTYKQAVKDAQWILERRARQMKEIRERQKAEELEAQRQLHLQMQGGNQRGGPAVKGNPGDKKGDGMQQRGEVQHNNFMNANSGNNTLQWQELNEVVVPKDRTKDVTVWIKPGVFVVKNVLTRPGNIFGNYKPMAHAQT